MVVSLVYLAHFSFVGTLLIGAFQCDQVYLLLCYDLGHWWFNSKNHKSLLCSRHKSIAYRGLCVYFLIITWKTCLQHIQVGEERDCSHLKKQKVLCNVKQAHCWDSYVRVFGCWQRSIMTWCDASTDSWVFHLYCFHIYRQSPIFFITN